MNDQEKFLAELDALLYKYNATLDVEFQSEWGNDVGEIVVNASTSTRTSDGKRVGTCFEINLGRSHGSFRPT